MTGVKLKTSDPTVLKPDIWSTMPNTTLNPCSEVLSHANIAIKLPLPIDLHSKKPTPLSFTRCSTSAANHSGGGGNGTA